MDSKENQVMRVLGALGIIFIVAGHIEFGLFTIKGIFPYYSFHVYIFLFIAGYFYERSAEEAPFKYVLKKAKAFSDSVRPCGIKRCCLSVIRECNRRTA